MSYEDPAVRAAYIAGVNAALDLIIDRMPAANLHEVNAWLGDLDAWQGGAPPRSPLHWPLGE